MASHGDVYPLRSQPPYAVEALASSPQNAGPNYFQFPAWVEICRQKSRTDIPEDLAPAYRTALKRLPQLVSAAASREWDATFLQCALPAIGASKSQPTIAEAVQELTPEVAAQFLEWFYQR